MQIIVPAAGDGSRFSNVGYKEPKPLINVLGKPLIKWSTDGLNIQDEPQFIFLLRKKHITENRIDEKLKDYYKNFEIIIVDELTEGQASTCLLAKDLINPDSELAIINCDNLFMIDLINAKNKLSIDDNSRGIVFYIAGNNPGWSYVDIDDNGYATKVEEKVMISNNATVGCYYFLKGKYFIEASEKMIKKNIRYNNEFYVSPAYNQFIAEGKKVHTWPCDFHYSLGTPELLEKFKSLFS